MDNNGNPLVGLRTRQYNDIDTKQSARHLLQGTTVQTQRTDTVIRKTMAKTSVTQP